MKQIVLILIVLVSSSFSPHAADDLIGTWWNAEKDAKIKIFLAQNGKYAGKTVWIKEPNDSKGNPKVDDKNPNAALRTMPRLGLAILKNFTYNSKNKRWEDGTLYDPKNGKTYDGYMYFDGNQTDKLSLRGYVMGMSMLGRTSVWEREK